MTLNELGALGPYEKLHLRDLLVNLLHELNDEVHELVFQHLLRVIIRDQEGNIISLTNIVSEYAIRLCIR